MGLSSTLPVLASSKEIVGSYGCALSGLWHRRLYKALYGNYELYELAGLIPSRLNMRPVIVVGRYCKPGRVVAKGSFCSHAPGIVVSFLLNQP